MKTPLVSICSITYNHAPFIRQCLDGFLMQQCNFPIEIIINDDCSTDGTTEIIREYAEKYPDKIFPVFHEENQWSKGERGIFQKFVFPKARGKYIALCEGDDYWTDPLKLQKQVDFLESHPDYSMCFHKAKVIAQDGRDFIDYFSKLEEREYQPEEVLTRWIIPTASILMRATVYVPIHKDFRTGDVVVHAACVASGKVYCMSKEMSVYRLHGTGWSAGDMAKPLHLSTLLPHLLAVMECFPRKLTHYYKKKTAFYTYLWLKGNNKSTERIPLRYLWKSIYYSNWMLLFFLVMQPTYKLLRSIGIRVGSIDPT